MTDYQTYISNYRKKYREEEEEEEKQGTQQPRTQQPVQPKAQQTSSEYDQYINSYREKYREPKKEPTMQEKREKNLADIKAQGGTVVEIGGQQPVSQSKKQPTTFSEKIDSAFNRFTQLTSRDSEIKEVSDVRKKAQQAVRDSTSTEVSYGDILKERKENPLGYMINRAYYTSDDKYMKGMGMTDRDVTPKQVIEKKLSAYAAYRSGLDETDRAMLDNPYKSLPDDVYAHIKLSTGTVLNKTNEDISLVQGQLDALTGKSFKDKVEGSLEQAGVGKQLFSIYTGQGFITEKSELDKYLKDLIEQKEDLEDINNGFVKHEGVMKGLINGFVKENIPVIGSAIVAGNAWDSLKAWKKFEKGEELNIRETRIVNEMRKEQVALMARERDMGYEVAESIMGSLALMAEIGLALAIPSPVDDALLLAKGGSKGLAKSIMLGAGNLLWKSAKITSTTKLPSVVGGVAEYQTDGYDLDWSENDFVKIEEGDELGKAIMKSVGREYGNTLIEIGLGEVVGGASNAVKKGLANKIGLELGSSNKGEVLKFLAEKGGWNGFLGEFAEEIAQKYWEEGVIDQKKVEFTGKELITIATSVLIMQAGFEVANSLGGSDVDIDRLREQAEANIIKVLTDGTKLDNDLAVLRAEAFKSAGIEGENAMTDLTTGRMLDSVQDDVELLSNATHTKQGRQYLEALNAQYGEELGGAIQMPLRMYEEFETETDVEQDKSLADKLDEKGEIAIKDPFEQERKQIEELEKTYKQETDQDIKQFTEPEQRGTAQVVTELQADIEAGRAQVNMTPDEQGDYVFTKDGIALPAYIPEALRSRKVLTEAVDAYLNETMPQEGTKAWQAYQLILEQGKQRGADYEVEAETKVEVKKPAKIEPVKKAEVKVKEVAKVEPLVTEARKYKSAEEFVETKPEVANKLLQETIVGGKQKAELKNLITNIGWDGGIANAVVDGRRTGSIQYEGKPYQLRFSRTRFEGRNVPNNVEGYVTRPIVQNYKTLEEANKALGRISKIQADQLSQLKEVWEKSKKPTPTDTKPSTKKKQAPSRASQDVVEKADKGGEKATRETKEKKTEKELKIPRSLEGLAIDAQRMTLKEFQDEFDYLFEDMGEPNVPKGEYFEGTAQEFWTIAQDFVKEVEPKKKIEDWKEDDPEFPFRRDANGNLILDDSKLDNMSLRMMENWNEALFGNKNVKLVQSIITPEGKDALGRLSKAWIEINRGKANKGSTYFHEAVHQAMEMFLTPTERATLLKAVRAHVGDAKLKKEWGKKTSVEKAKLVSFQDTALRMHDSAEQIANKGWVGTAEGRKRIKARLGLTEEHFKRLDILAESVGINPSRLSSSAVVIRNLDTNEMSYRLVEGKENATHAIALIDQSMGHRGQVGNLSYEVHAITPLLMRFLNNPYANIKKFDPRTLPYSYDPSQAATEREYRIKFGITKNGRGKYKGDTAQDMSLDAIAEEWLADNIIDYMNGTQSFTGKIRRMVENFIERWKKGVSYRAEFDKFYSDLLSGKLLKQNQKLQKQIEKSKERYINEQVDQQMLSTGVLYRQEVAKAVDKLTTKILNRIGDRADVSKQFISNLTKQQDISKVESDLILDVLKDSGDKISVADFKKDVMSKLLPLERITLSSGRYENIALTDEKRGDVNYYTENIYSSPIQVRAGEKHWSFSMGDVFEAEDQAAMKRDDKAADNYFGHTRVEDVGDLYLPNANDGVRRVIEIQSDLYQKGQLEAEVQWDYVDTGMSPIAVKRENPNIKLADIKKGDLVTYNGTKYLITENTLDTSPKGLADWEANISGTGSLSGYVFDKKAQERQKKIEVLHQYKNPTAHLRMLREEIRQASLDGVRNMQFPTGETGMYIEQLAGQGNKNFLHYEDSTNLKPTDLVYGQKFNDTRHRGLAYSNFVVLEITGKETFKAIPLTNAAPDFLHEDNNGDFTKEYIKTLKQYVSENKNLIEEFSIAEEVDTSNPIYKFYEEEIGKYLKNNYDAKLVTDKQGVTWWQVEIKPEHGNTVEAFKQEKLANYKEIAKNIRGKIREQVGGDITQPLVTLHQTQLENLIEADRDWGGEFSGASLAVTKPDIGLKGFGDITLVGDRAMVDPMVNSDNKLYSHDVYSPRKPDMQHDLNRKVFEKFYYNDKIENAHQEVGSNMNIYNEAKLEKRKMLGEMLDHPAMMNLYLEEKGKKVEPVMEVVGSVWSNFLETETFKANKDFFMQDIDWDSPNREKLVKQKVVLLKKMVDEIVSTETDPVMAKLRKEALMENFSGKLWDMYPVRDLIERREKGKVVNRIETREQIYEAMKELAKDRDYKAEGTEYYKWIEKQIEGMYSEPYMEIGRGKKVPATPEYHEMIIKSMFNKGVRGQEGGIFNKGINNIKAYASKKYKSIEQAKRDSYGRLVDEKKYAHIVATQASLIDKYAEQAHEYHKYPNAEWYGSNAPFTDMLMDYAKGSRTMAAFESAAIRNGYDFSSQGDYLIDKYKSYADRFFADPVPYLEAKLGRPVRLEEFTGVIVNKQFKKSEEFQRIANKYGWRVEYIDPKQGEDGHEVRAKVINSKFDDVKYKRAENESPEAKKQEMDHMVSIKLPELVGLANDLGTDIKMAQKIGRKGARGVFYHKDGTPERRIKILYDLFEPKGDIAIDPETGQEVTMPETQEQREERVLQIEKTLGHEIGHLVDWLGDESDVTNLTLKRGNILGHIANLRNYLERDFRGYDNIEIRKELKALTHAWHPFDPNTAPKSYKNYRYSAKELYAEGLSVMFNNPQMLRDIAPQFHAGFMEFVARKPQVKKELFAVWDMIKEGGEIQARLDRMDKSYEEGMGRRMNAVERAEATRNQRRWQNVIMKAKFLLAEEHAPYLMKVRKLWRDGGIERSKLIEIEMLMDDLNFQGDKQFLYARDVQDNFFIPISEAGINVNDVGKILELERDLGDRIDLANPQGLQYDYAKETYDLLKSKYTPAQWATLQEKLSWWRDFNFELVKEATEAGVYSKEFFDTIATVNKNTYTPFAVVHYIDNNYVSAGIMKAKGTVKGVENPINTQMLKSMQIIRATVQNRAKNSLRETLQDNFSHEIIEAEAKKTDTGARIGWKVNQELVDKGMEILEMSVDGRVRGYYVDKSFTGMFGTQLFADSFTNEGMDAIMKGFKAFNGVFKPMVTSLNPSFMFKSNIERDVKRSLSLLSGMSYYWYGDQNAMLRTAKVHGAYLTQWMKGLKTSWDYAHGRGNAITEQMLKYHAISAQITHSDIDLGTDQVYFDAVKKKVVSGSKVNWIEKALVMGEKVPLAKNSVVPLAKLYIQAGNTFEINSKVAGYNYLIKMGLNPREAAYHARKYTGTPDYMEKGKITRVTNVLDVFSNVHVQALSSTLDVGFSAHTASGFWMAKFFHGVLPKLLQLYFASALFKVPIPDPDEPEETIWVNPYDYFSEYEKSAYHIIPFYYDEATKKFSAFKFAMDEDERIVAMATWKLGRYLQGEGMKVEQLAEMLVQYIPMSSFVFGGEGNPLNEFLGGWKDYAQGRNPYDDFRGRPAIHRGKWDEGGSTRFKEMLKWSSNTMGLTKFKTYDKELDTLYEKVLQLPLIERTISHSDYGLTEQKDWEEMHGKKVKEKEMEIVLKDFYADPTDENLLKYQEKYVKLIKGDPPKDGWTGTEKAEETRLKSNFKKEIFVTSGDSKYERLAKATSNEDKVEILRKQQNVMESKDFEDYMAQAVRYEVVKGEMFADYVEKYKLSDKAVYKVVKESIPVLGAESNNTLIWELRKRDLLSNEYLQKLRQDNLITSAGYGKYIEVTKRWYELRYDKDNKTTAPKPSLF